MICVVIGIVPPLEESERIGQLKLLEAAHPKLRWTRESWNEQPWIVPDADEDDVPTLLLSAILGSVHEEEPVIEMDPNEFVSWVREQLHQNRTDGGEDDDVTTVDYRCEVWASAPAPLPLVRSASIETAFGTSEATESKSIVLDRLQSEFRRTGLCVLSGVLSSGEEECADSDSVSLTRHLLSLVDDHIRSSEAAIAKNHPDIVLGTDSFWFREIASRSKQRFDLLVPKDTELYKLVSKTVFGRIPNADLDKTNSGRGKNNDEDEDNDESFGSINREGLFRSDLLRRLFANSADASTETPSPSSSIDWEMDLSVVYSKPGANHQGWHADGGHAEGAPDAGWIEHECIRSNSTGASADVSAAATGTAQTATTAKTAKTTILVTTTTNVSPLAVPYAVCLFVPLIDLDRTVGFTQFWPGSHRHRALVGFGPFAEVSGATWDGIVSAGDAVWYDYRLLHRGMPNCSSQAAEAAKHGSLNPPPYRPVLQLLCRRTWYKEKNNYGHESIYGTSSSD